MQLSTTLDAVARDEDGVQGGVLGTVWFVGTGVEERDGAGVTADGDAVDGDDPTDCGVRRLRGFVCCRCLISLVSSTRAVS